LFKAGKVILFPFFSHVTTQVHAHTEQSAAALVISLIKYFVT